MIKQNKNQYIGLTEDKTSELPHSSTMLDTTTGEQYYSVHGVLEPIKDPGAVRTNPVGEPAGSSKVLNVVALTQAEYDAAGASLVATTLYLITD